ncbi:MAG: hypothetical protein DI551_07285 [Micavibrio aeruginosavorus]|uniref:Type IV secretion system protein n=1 Tax=Micavibrio aeruginosavorus TaxID=349221 RepID=A0A2W5MW68_9BACT|nr:MAG: hypothetical protein DI551_07285 [Micavibrio aeruginosavorus]
MEQLILNVDNIISGFVEGSFGSLTGVVRTLWHLMFIVFIAIYGYKVMISNRFSAPDIVWHCVRIVVLLIVATQWDAFLLFFYDITTKLPSDIAGQMMQAAAKNMGAVSTNPENTANSALHEFFDRGNTVTSKILEGAGWDNLGQYTYALAVWSGTIGVAGYAVMLIILSKLAVAILLAVGPLFILLLIFANTKSLFEGWLRTLLNYAVIPIFVYTLLSLILTILETSLVALEKDSEEKLNLISSVGPFLLTSFVSILLLAQILNMAASVTGGVSLSTMGTGAWTARKIGGAGIATAKGAMWVRKKYKERKASSKENKDAEK